MIECETLAEGEDFTFQLNRAKFEDSALICSESACSPSRTLSPTLDSPRDKSTTSSWSADPPVSLRFSSSSPTSSTERPSTEASTPMRLSPTELLFRLPCSMESRMRRSRASACSMLLPSPRVLRPRWCHDRADPQKHDRAHEEDP